MGDFSESVEAAAVMLDRRSLVLVEYIEKKHVFLPPSFSSSRIWLMVIAVSVHLAMQAITVKETSMNAPATPV